ncbi:bone morphogenetic protein 7-like [Diabrotica virgifera virgifera]|uniref:TGF-beta family profile domain-containing protein n=1 Tax=Diabrotica virgifera virgifera TaxID=50390 RepID=A0ABM5JJT6_DIAVI|nr:bone morphogenetic protein 7-like [Diabrotica virgifera virgifera]
MYKFISLAVVIGLSWSQNTSNSGKSYFFKRGKNSNEFKVNNRIMYLNHNITDFDYAYPVVEKKRVIQTFQPVEKSPPKLDFGFYLDKEWNYNHKENAIDTSQLPIFVKKFYEEFSSTIDKTLTARILFNKNANTSSSIIKFNLDSLVVDDAVLDADLYFYWPLKNTSKIFKESVVLRLYQYEKKSIDEKEDVGNPDMHKLFNVIYVSKAHKGWQMFKVKKPIDNWLNGEENMGLILTISTYDSNELIEVFNDTNTGNFSTFVVVKTRSNDTLIPTKDPETSIIEDQGTIPHCQRQEWIINFQKMGWNKFIIFPEEFSAYDCVGKCLKPTGDNANHAKMLHIFQKRSACCVPVSYEPLPIMYFDKFGNIAAKNYDNTVVAECKCR